MNLKAIVATATTEKEAELICSEIFKSLRPHAYVHFFKIEGCQVTVVYEPNTARFERMNKEAKQALSPAAKKPAKQLTIEDLEAKIKELGLDKDLFVCVGLRNPDRPQKYIIHDTKWNHHIPGIFESTSAIAVSRKLTKIYKERQAAKIGHVLALDPSQPIDIQKVCPHCDRPLEKGQICCVHSLVTGKVIQNKLTVGDAVTLKPCAKPVECNDFSELLPYHFTSTDVGTLVSVKSPRMRSKPGCSKYQAIVNFSKEGARAYLTARVELSDLLLADNKKVTATAAKQKQGTGKQKVKTSS